MRLQRLSSSITASGMCDCNLRLIFNLSRRLLTVLSDNRYPRVWTSVAVKELFEGKSSNNSNSTVSRNNSTVSQTNSTVSQNTSKSAIPAFHHHPKPGVIFGIASGCVAAVAVCVIGVVFLKKRQRNNVNAGVPVDNPIPSMLFESSPQEFPVEERVHEILSKHQHHAELSSVGERILH